MKAQVRFRESDKGHWVAYVADAPRIEGAGLTKDEALGDLVRRNARHFMVVPDGHAADVQVGEHGAQAATVEVFE